ncbi:hydroxylamine reductase [Treponema sp. J25]|uniref:hydroxylamine reductase n=1 Tax=Treponema sp. J25 TaxID=2094121 RepID=UPI00104727D4|nr:hydroxylamine reductase [Treponema sp. J25]TCW61085.1 hydroxylamine reductase [Treponema sp. J25]
MFCYQCQEAMNGTGCAVAKGVCGKDSQTSDLQDLLIHTLKGIGVWASFARAVGKPTPMADQFVMESLFATITNANFDGAYFVQKITEGLQIRQELQRLVGNELVVPQGLHKDIANSDAAIWKLPSDQFPAKAQEIGFLSIEDVNRRSLVALLVFGLKGMAAYAHHAAVLGYTDDNIFAFMHRALAATVDSHLETNALIQWVLECGSVGVTTMALLDKANTATYGKPEITRVSIGVRHNPGILISGHDLKDLEMLLEQTAGTGVDVYTHSEMLPAHYYPTFKKYPHFAGNYGNAWWKQKEEFEKFNGPILMTTNCLVPPSASYKDRLFTTGIVGFPGVPHIEADHKGWKDFSALVELAKTCPPPTPIEEGEIIGGFAHDQVAALVPQVVGAIKASKIRKFVVMAGCDGRMKSRAYYEEFARALPRDTVILTAGCAKYRYNKLPLGDIEGIPRVLDAGQCNDSYSLAVTALTLKEAFALADVNDLPIAFNIAWYEQKAVLVLLALLSLGFKNIHIGPTLPAFLSPEVAEVLVKTFNLGTIGTVEEDIKLLVE